MPKSTKTLLSILLIAAVYLGSSQLYTNSDAFASAMLRCCNNGLCHNTDCTAGSSILFCSGNEYSYNCEFCMDVISSLKSCDRYSGSWPTWCNLSDGTKYYAWDW